MSLEGSIKQLLNKSGLEPIKYRGQNFLINESLLKDIVALAKIKPGETVLEIGAGVGNLTKELLEAGAKVIAVEKDKNLVSLLENNLKNKDLTVINSDILKLDKTKIPTKYKVVGNIPYFITGPIIREFLLKSPAPSLIVLTIQKEVGERMVANPPKSNFLSVMLSFMANVRIEKNIKSDNFWPQPKVDSVVVSVVPKVKKVGIEKQINFIKKAFSQPRKTLLNNLSDKRVGLKKEKLLIYLLSLGYSKTTRAHEVKQKDWEKIFKEVGV